ncbi:MAG: glycosyltransferase, partial [Hyphomonadaceae bacterium]
HPEALLLTAWHSPWPQLAKTLDRSRIAAPIALDSAGRLDVKAWAAANGINPDQAADLGAQPNASMPDLLRDIDVALLPSRAEGGTNLVAMEAMAAGAPVILSHNTGHRELVASGATIALERQTRAPWGFAGVDGVEGWGESDVDEIVAALERVHADRAASRAIGAKAAAFMRGMTWAQTAHRMKELALAA